QIDEIIEGALLLAAQKLTPVGELPDQRFLARVDGRVDRDDTLVRCERDGVTVNTPRQQRIRGGVGRAGGKHTYQQQRAQEESRRPAHLPRISVLDHEATS